MKTICTLDQFMENMHVAMVSVGSEKPEAKHPKPTPDDGVASIIFSKTCCFILQFQEGTEEIKEISMFSAPDGSQYSGYTTIFAAAVAIAASGQFGSIQKGYIDLKTLGLLDKKNIRNGFKSFFTPIFSKYGISLDISEEVGIRVRICDKKFI